MHKYFGKKYHITIFFHKLPTSVSRFRKANVLPGVYAPQVGNLWIRLMPLKRDCEQGLGEINFNFCCSQIHCFMLRALSSRQATSAISDKGIFGLEVVCRGPFGNYMINFMLIIRIIKFVSSPRLGIQTFIGRVSVWMTVFTIVLFCSLEYFFKIQRT